jgi:hypothetical protein
VVVGVHTGERVGRKEGRHGQRSHDRMIADPASIHPRCHHKLETLTGHATSTLPPGVTTKPLMRGARLVSN